MPDLAQRSHARALTRLAARLGNPWASALDPSSVVASLQTAGHDVLAVFVAEDLPNGAGNGTHWTPRYTKPGTTIPDMVLTGAVSKATNASGTIVARSAGGYIKSAAAAAAYDLSLGLAVYPIATANTANGCVAAVQDAQDFATPTRRMALVTDNNLQGRNHANVDYMSPSSRYHLRCTLDANLRSWGFSVAPFVAGETGARYNVQRSADHPCENNNSQDTVRGRGAWGSNASDITPSAGANFIQIWQSSGVWGSGTDDCAGFIVCRTPQNADSALIVEQFAEDYLKAFKETGKRVVVIGDSRGVGFSAGKALGTTDWTGANADGGNAALQAAMPAGFLLSSACWGGESAWSAYTHRRDFFYPLWLNARSRAEVIVIIELGVNDLPWSAEYQEPGGSAAINANVLALIQWIQSLPGGIRTVLNNIGPAWVDGSANPTDPRETTRIAVNTAYAAQVGSYNRLRLVTADATIGQPGENMNATYYDNSDGLHTHMTVAGYDIRRTMAAADAAAVA